MLISVTRVPSLSAILFQGRINFDHQKKKLDILMVPTDGGDMLMNTESLSGGEKSFSTVAFLMALWSNMELPFYSLDEYDVFMVRCYKTYIVISPSMLNSLLFLLRTVLVLSLRNRICF